MTERPLSEYERGFNAGLEAQGYDSRPDTYAHIQMVQRLMGLVILSLQKRALVHDASKLVDPERSAYDGLPLKLAGLEYGSPEYRAQLQDPAIKGHQRGNDHHPEAHYLGIHGMHMGQMMEMICDWIAATRRTKDGNIWKSIDMNAERFGYGDEIRDLLRKTAEWILLMETKEYQGNVLNA